MMNDCWRFGLLLDSGFILAIDSIDKITMDATGDLWIDITMDVDGKADCVKFGSFPILRVPTSRPNCSIRAKSVVLAMELADT